MMIMQALKRLLHFPSDEIAMHRRAAFVSIAQSATLMSSNTRSNLAQLLKGSLDRYHLYDSGLDIDRGEGGGRRWTADEWLLAHHRAAFAGDSPLSQSLPNFFFLPDLAAGHEGSGRGRSAGLGNCMFFLSDYEDMRKRVLCVVQVNLPSTHQPIDMTGQANITSNKVSSHNTIGVISCVTLAALSPWSRLQYVVSLTTAAAIPTNLDTSAYVTDSTARRPDPERASSGPVYMARSLYVGWR